MSKDLKENSKFAKEFFEGVKTNPGLVDAWKVVNDFSGNVSRNVDVLNLLSNNEGLTSICNLLKNGNRTKLYSSLTEFDEAIIYHYTKYSSEVRSVGGDFYSTYKVKLNEALEKLPESLNNDEIVHGGYNFSDELIGQFTNGNYVEFEDLLSTTRLKSIADDFLKIKGGNVYIQIIDSYDGKFIESLSSFPEKEVLFTSDAMFKVKGTPVRIPHPNGVDGETVLKVILEQQ